jgi:hypothetical protein
MNTEISIICSFTVLILPTTGFLSEKTITLLSKIMYEKNSLLSVFCFLPGKYFRSERLQLLSHKLVDRNEME